MSSKTKLTFPLVSVSTLLATAAVFILPITMGISSVGALWPLIPTTFFFAYGISIITGDDAAWWGGAFFFGSFFLCYLLDHAEVIPFSRSWPLLILVIILLIFAGFMTAKKKSKNK